MQVLCFKVHSGLVNCPTLAHVFLRKPSKTKAFNIVDLHERFTRFLGCWGSFMQLKCAGRAFQQHWFGFQGKLNDFNISGRSVLFQSIMNGQHITIEHDFVVDRIVFSNFSILLRIYPCMFWLFGTEWLVEDIYILILMSFDCQVLIVQSQS
jgi:hypothetical protein